MTPMVRGIKNLSGWSGLKLFGGGLIAVLFILPLFAGVAGTLLPAIGFAPQLAPDNGLSGLLTDPRFFPALSLSIKTGLTATLFVFVLCLLSLVCLHGTRLWRWMFAMMPPLLAVPHAAMAVGLVFLIAPSGWVVRVLSPSLTGWQRPPTAWVIPDSGGWTLILGLVIKETPFLLLVAAAHLATLNVNASLQIGRTLGYAPARCWSRLILPLLYPRIRLSLFIILAFNLSVVDMALLLGPGNPPTLSVLLLSLVNDPGSRAAASAGALLLVAVVIVVFAVMRILEAAVQKLAAYRRQNGHRGYGFGSWRTLGQAIVLGVMLVSVVSLITIVIWSVVQRWRFPAALPTSWTLEHWTLRTNLLLEPLQTTALFAIVSCLFAVVSAIAWLELERQGTVPKLDWLWYIPLLIPQISLLFGWQAAALLLSIDGSWITVTYAHWVYSLPYVILILAVTWREFDINWDHAASVLGAGYWRVLFQVRLPLLIKPVCQAAAVGIAISVAQYLPTALLGAGRHQTLATELVTSFGGVDRRVIASLALLQSLLPLAAFVAAILIPAKLKIHRGHA